MVERNENRKKMVMREKQGKKEEGKRFGKEEEEEEVYIVRGKGRDRKEGNEMERLNLREGRVKRGVYVMQGRKNGREVREDNREETGKGNLGGKVREKQAGISVSGKSRNR